MKLLSERGIPLVLQELPQKPTLTIENYQKWYDIYLVMPDGKTMPYRDYDDIEARFRETTWGDHVINPDFFRAIALLRGFDIDERSFEIVVGRWHIEYLGKYPIE